MRVLLVHGLGRTPASFLRLALALRRCGCTTDAFSYAAFAQSFDSIVHRLVRRLEQMAGGPEYAVVGHSLGGILLRAALPGVRGGVPRHFVMLGTPNRPPRAARLAWRMPPFRWMSGECGACLSSRDFYAALPPPGVPYTIIAGTRGVTGRWSPFGTEPNDGLVALSETRVCDSDPVVALPVSHTFMMNDLRVLASIRASFALAPSVTEITTPGTGEG